MRSQELSAWLECIEEESKKSDIIIVPGGGEFADNVRELQRSFKFSDQLAHKMALLAMTQFGYLLHELNPSIKVVHDINTLFENLGKGLPLLWLPMTLLDDFTEISANWDYSSDSIALWLAMKLSATRLILVKSMALTDDESTFMHLIDKGYLDKGFQGLVGQYKGDVLWFNKNQYQQLHQVLAPQASYQDIKFLNSA